MAFSLPTDVNTTYTKFMDNITHAYDNSFRLKKVKIKNENKNPWFSCDMQTISKKKLKVYELFLSNRSSINRERYKQFRNKFTKTLRKAKKQYYKDKLKNVSGNMAATWKILNS